MSFTDQSHINTAYAMLHEALNHICLVQNKDKYLIHMQNKLYALENTLHDYVGPSKEAK